jgi:phosphate transport system substrate-binding protein
MEGNNMKRLNRHFSTFILALGVAASAQAGSITVKGSDTLVILAQKWAEVYMGKHADVKIQVTGGGSGVGFAALQNQTTDLADASRKIRPREIEACLKSFGKRPTEYKVCLDGLSVYVSDDNKVKELSLPQLEAIFTGKVRNWKEVGGQDAPITVYSRENSSGTYEFFKEHVLQGKDFAASAQTMPGTASLMQAVAKDKSGIGYGGAAYGTGAKHLLIKKDGNSPAIEPTEETVVKGTYPIWRHLYIYVNPALDKGETAAYLNWIRSDEGQKVVKDVGYYPLPKHLRE